MDLFDWAPARGKTETSHAAAEKIAPVAATLREKAYAIFCADARFGDPEHTGLTADEVAHRMGVDILAIRPRITELKEMGKIEFTGRTRQNARGNSQRIYRKVQR